ncbi:sugar phosphate isomerase/epimerase [Bradyrhizobium sp. BR 10261]|uniref:sugar phosphate isomerase/epimerase family protein n=1 Tax=Bradyrhizobium sp. BR 10261 TaxID=2749992 RepID=UPI001C64CE13|nr:sugar phosphate isomerase/epimerase [Bradyrhizobium sp. BR 10261]MBW7963683.1 sugar phosphate isomerase/epimerase [Bradyrhizobium sp. BR 10261]
MTTPINHLSFQLYSARSIEPLEAQFKLLAGLGYRMVEPWGALFNDPDTLKRLLHQYDMTAPSAHVGLDRLRSDAVGTAKLCKGLGIETIFAPAPPPGEREGGETEWRGIGRELAAIGKAVTGEGLRFGWHNHHWEYGRTASGLTYLECLFEEAPELVWEADLAWIVRGNGDPVAEIRKHARRLVACHIKDLAPSGQCLDEDGWADPGHGTMDWAALLAAMKEANVSLFVAEHDKPNDVARFARRARETVAAWN